MKNTLKFLFQIINGVVTQSELPESSDDVNWELLYKVSSVHNISNIVAHALMQKKYCIQDNLKQAFSKSFYLNIMVDEVQKKEAASIFSAFSQKNLDYMPLKGIRIKEIYPSGDMRRMGDIDILIRNDEYEKYKDVLHENGYIFIEESGNEYVFKKDPYVLVELHKCLISPGNTDMCEYYKTGWDIAKSNAEEKNQYIFSVEDEFVYMITHFAKHYRSAGVGIKPVIDIWLYAKKHISMDMKYVYEQLDKMNLKVFTEKVMQLTKCWFENEESNSWMEEMTQYIINSGEYGSSINVAAAESVYKNYSKKGTMSEKIKIYLSIIFLDYGRMKNLYPILKKTPFLLPFLWLYRFFDRIISKKDAYTHHKNVTEAKFGDNVMRYCKHMENVGMNVLEDNKR